MISTTLMTFLYQAPVSAITVELIGSWDRFSRSYPLRRDDRTGPGHWRGCHTFTDITCDGETLDLSAKRDGGLKMGGKYWYFYRLDGVVEYHNPAEPSTLQCPFLPGQQVNILDVPVQAYVESDYQYSSLRPIESDLYTLDPKAKYLKLQPSVRSASWAPSQTSLGSFPPLATPVEALTPTRTFCKVKSIYQKSIYSTAKTILRQKSKSSRSSTKRFLFAPFHIMRATRSAGLVGPDPNSSKQSSVSIPIPTIREAKGPDPNRSKQSSVSIPIPTTREAKVVRNGSIGSVMKKIDVTSEDYLHIIPAYAVSHSNITQPLADRKPKMPVLEQVCSHERLSPLILGPAEDEAPHHIPSGNESKVLSIPSFQATLQQLREMIGFSNQSSSRRKSTPNATARSTSDSISGQPEFSGKQVGQEEHDEFLRIEDIYSGRQDSADSTSSYATNNLFSPGLASSSVYTEGMSPYHLSPPATPDKNKRSHDLVRSSRPVSEDTETHEIPSSDIIEKLRESLAAANIQDKPYPDSSLHRQGNRALLTSWINGSDHLTTDLGDLLDDLEYLRDLIS